MQRVPEEQVILVDELDRPTGVAEKLCAHRDGGRLHRAFSIFLFDADGRMLLQRRSRRKYHFGGLWSNACCGHPRPGESVEEAARRRLGEELGIAVALTKVHAFIYSAADDRSGLTEREYDHVFVGRCEGMPRANPDEIDELRWADRNTLEASVAVQPERYTPWFVHAVRSFTFLWERGA